MTPYSTQGRRGVALLTALWLTAALSAVILVAEIDARDAVAAARNRMGIERGHWMARGCLAVLTHAIDAWLASATDDAMRQARWRHLDRDRSKWMPTAGSECAVRLEAVGARLPINAADRTMLISLFEAVGLGDGRFDLAESLLDWTDPDDSVRHHGAEIAWYRAMGRITPRNGPLVDVAELAHVRGFERAHALLRPFVTTADVRVSLDHAPRAVLLALPGFSLEAAERLLERRTLGQPPDDVRSLIDLVSGSAAERLRERFPELAVAAVAGTPGWYLDIGTSIGTPAVGLEMRAELSRTSHHVAIDRWEFR